MFLLVPGFLETLPKDYLISEKPKPSIGQDKKRFFLFDLEMRERQKGSINKTTDSIRQREGSTNFNILVRYFIK